MKQESFQHPLTVRELLAEIALRKTNPKRAERAYIKFDEKYRERVLGICRDLCWKFDKRSYRENAQDICQLTLMKVWLNADKYDSTKSQPITWIARIAKNELIGVLEKQLPTVAFDASQTEDFFLLQNSSGKQNGQGIPTANHGGLESDMFDVEEIRQHPNQEAVENALRSLSEREEDIVRTTLLHDPFNVPHTELDRIEKAYGITRDNIRAIRKRALEKISNLIGEVLDKKPEV